MQDCMYEHSFILLLVVACKPLKNPNFGMVTCSLNNYEAPSYEVTCSFTCNTGYELTGSDTRTCQSDGSWSGTNTMCRSEDCLYVNVLCNVCTHLRMCVG